MHHFKQLIHFLHPLSSLLLSPQKTQVCPKLVLSFTVYNQVMSWFDNWVENNIEKNKMGGGGGGGGGGGAGGGGGGRRVVPPIGEAAPVMPLVTTKG